MRNYSDRDFILGMQCGVIECAAWADAPEDYEEGNGFSEESEARLDQETEAFYHANRLTLRACNMTPEQCGHDLWLTAVGHGAGFWDRGLGRIGDKLTKAAMRFPLSHVWVNDNGFLEVE